MTSVCHECGHCYERADYAQVFRGTIPIPFLGWIGGTFTEFQGYSYWCDAWEMTNTVTGRKSMAKCGRDVNTKGDCKLFESGSVGKLEPSGV